ncbi:DinB family protein [Cellulomonas sp. JH27-2]|uniref:DinB family protein n=1 Tax=Cellulomonas sp. JH27-2 TaxID=2774139 RepID=UPI001781E573|nr:DinB family protein [Cellulomonas sp. JH27-2]MBD8060352.1 DinB family protein [Cellulomonas sp. JH27-2]
MDDKANLHDYLRTARSDLLGKLDGLSEYDARRPLTPTGTNLLGLVRHVATTQLGYFTDTFGRPSGVDQPWADFDADPDGDMWVPADESRASVVEFHHLSARLSDEAIDALPLDAPGEVPWWSPEKRAVTLQQILVHMLAETARHAGHADILRELIDEQVGRRADDPNIPDRTAADWSAYREKLEQAARRAAEA